MDFERAIVLLDFIEAASKHGAPYNIMMEEARVELAEMNKVAVKNRDERVKAEASKLAADTAAAAKAASDKAAAEKAKQDAMFKPAPTPTPPKPTDNPEDEDTSYRRSI